MKCGLYISFFISLAFLSPPFENVSSSVVEIILLGLRPRQVLVGYAANSSLMISFH